jgi:leucyl-tRNA synthetase
MSRYNFSEAEPRWQTVWAEHGCFAAGRHPDRPKYYVLEMFPYPSGRIHMGHVRNYTMGDVVARFKRAQGFDVLHPMGWDAFGLPAENAAMRARASIPATGPTPTSPRCAAQLQRMGLSLDWDREIATCDPGYYGTSRSCSSTSASRPGLSQGAAVNWDPVDQTVLANEQVIDGRGWRSGALVEKRKLTSGSCASPTMPRSC